MGCGCSTAFGIIELSSGIDLLDQFRGSVCRKVSFAGFSEYSVLKLDRPSAEFGELGKGLYDCDFNAVFSKCVERALLQYVRTNPNSRVHIDNHTVGDSIHFQGEIARSFAAHVFGSPQVYTTCDANGSILSEKRHAPLEQKSKEAWGVGICDNGKGKLDPSSNDAVSKKALELRMLNALLQSLRTYNFQEHFQRIIGNKIALISNRAVAHLV